MPTYSGKKSAFFQGIQHVKSNQRGEDPPEGTGPTPAFVEVPVPWPGPVGGSTLIEVERPDGARLRLQYRDAPPLATVLRAFLEPA